MKGSVRPVEPVEELVLGPPTELGADCESVEEGAPAVVVAGLPADEVLVVPE